MNINMDKETNSDRLRVLPVAKMIYRRSLHIMAPIINAHCVAPYFVLVLFRSVDFIT